jgi:hypothetical protein
VEDVSGYGQKSLPFDIRNKREVTLRSPEPWLNTIRCPTFVFEGTEPPGNIDSLRSMAQASDNSKLHFHAIEGRTHFSVLAPVTRLIAAKIHSDRGPATNIRFSDTDLFKLSSK